MTEQVISGAGNALTGSGSKTKNIKQVADNRASIQDRPENAELDGSAAETNNNNPPSHLEGANCTSDKNERRVIGSNTNNNHNNNKENHNHNGHHRHRRHSSGSNSSPDDRRSSSASSLEIAVDGAGLAQSDELKLGGQLNAAAATSGETGHSELQVSVPKSGGAATQPAPHALNERGAISTVISIGQSSAVAVSSSSGDKVRDSDTANSKQVSTGNGKDVHLGELHSEIRNSGSAPYPIVSEARLSDHSAEQRTAGQIDRVKEDAGGQAVTNSNKQINAVDSNFFQQQAINFRGRDLKQQDQNNSIYATTFDSDNQLLQDCDASKRWSISSSSGNQFCKRRKLSYLQSLLLRKWPYLAISICIMSSLLFGILLSGLTVYLIHAAADCSGLARANIAESGANPPLLAAVNTHELLRRPNAEYPETANVDTVASLTGSGLNFNGDQSAALQHRALAGAAGSDSASNSTARFQRLPSSLWPLHYDLFIQPYIAEPFNFTGKVSIRIKCTEATDNITLHAVDLDLNESTLSLQLAPQNGQTASRLAVGQQRERRKLTSSAPKVRGLSTDKQLQYLIIRLDSPLEVGQEYVLSIDFVGLLNEDLAGFYKIKYERQNSSETTSADGLWVTDTFSKSQRMSTYLVAYTVTNFESRSEGNISVWTRPGFTHTAEYALKTAGAIMRYYEDFFGIGYPLPKMDMIALPDFNAGAMENWGLIAYRETAMLYDEGSSSISNKQRIAVVVAHELAHQWFGNLVTPKWWDDLWLNEGFASYVEYIGVDHVEPKWRMLDQFVVEEVQNVLKTDGLSSSHQISIPVNNPDEISEIFDHISYAKGASIIRMMNHFLTLPVFKEGLRRYLSALKYGNAEQSDLWAHLTEAQRISTSSNGTAFSKQLGVDVGKVMNSWTLQTGYPLVTLTRQYGPSKSAQLEQARYHAFKVQTNNTVDDSATNQNLTSVGSMVASNQKWEIPITFTSKSEQNWQPKTRLWMHQADQKPIQLNTSLVPASDDEWMLLNVNQVGFYRVNYDIRNWKLLIDQLNTDHKQIITTNRAQILDDIFELARSGTIDYRFAMEATKYLKGERDYLPWETVLMSFSYIDDMLQRTSIYGDWKDYVTDLIAPYYSRYKDMDWLIRKGQLQQANKTDGNAVDANRTPTDVEDVLDQYNLVNSIAWACQVDEHCIRKSQAIFNNWRQSGKNEINPALRYTIYCAAIENGSKDDWNFLWKVYEKEPNASERDRIIRALGCTKEIWLLSRYLEWTFSKTKPIRRQDGAFVFRVIAKNNYGRDIAFNFMRERWSTIKEFYGKTSFSLGNLIRAVSTSMNTQVELNQLMTFYETIKNDGGTGKRSFQIAIEEVESNVLWRNRSYKIIEDWIQEARNKATQPGTGIAA